MAVYNVFMGELRCWRNRLRLSVFEVGKILTLTPGCGQQMLSSSPAAQVVYHQRVNTAPSSKLPNISFPNTVICIAKQNWVTGFTSFTTGVSAHKLLRLEKLLSILVPQPRVQGNSQARILGRSLVVYKESILLLNSRDIFGYFAG